MSEMGRSEQHSRRVCFALLSGNPKLRPPLPRSPTTGREQMQQRMWRKAGYSITSSARASSVGGTVRPRDLAVLRLITSSYFVDA